MWPFSSKAKQLKQHLARVDEAAAALNAAIQTDDASPDKRARFDAAVQLADATAELDLVVIAHLQYAIWLGVRGDHAAAQPHALRALEALGGALQQDAIKAQAATRFAKHAPMFGQLPDDVVTGQVALDLASAALMGAEALSTVTMETRNGKIVGDAPAFDHASRLALYDLAIRGFERGAREGREPLFAETHAHRADTLMQLGREADAEPGYWRARNGFAKSVGETHDVVVRIDHKLATCMLAQQRESDALAAWDRAFSTVRAQSAPTPQVFQSMMAYGHYLETKSDDASKARVAEIAALFRAAEARGTIESLA